MALPRFHKLDPERQQTILAAAEAEFSARGLSGASYNAIIKAAGLSKGAMYYYFADKADLFRTVIERALDRMVQSIGDLGPFEDAVGYWAEVRGLAERAVALFADSPELVVLGRLLYGEGATSDVLADLIARSEAWVARALERGRAVGAVRRDLPLDLLATAITGVLVHTDRWLAVRLDTLEPAEIERLSGACLDMVEQLASDPADLPPRT